MAIALPIAFVVSRLPHRVIRRLAWPGDPRRDRRCSALTRVPGLGVEVNGNQNWLALGPITIQPSELAKLAVILWCADLYARKERLLGDWRHALIPMVPVTGLVTLLVVLAAATSAPRWCCSRSSSGCSGWSARPARLFVVALTFVGVLALWLATTSQERLERLTNFADPFKDFQGAGWQAAHGLFAMSTRRHLRQGHLAPASRSGATCPPPTPTSSSRCSARSSAWSAPCWCSGCS